MLILAAMDRKEKNSESRLSLPKGMLGLFFTVAAYALSILEPGCPSLTLTLLFRNSLFFSLLFIFGMASANIWSQILLTKKRKNDAV